LEVLEERLLILTHSKKNIFESVVQTLQEIEGVEAIKTLWREADQFDEILKLSTGAIAHGLSAWDTRRFDQLNTKSKVDPWSHDSMKMGAVELQQMHPLLSKHTAQWTADFMKGTAKRPSKSGPQPNSAKEICKQLIHLLVDAAEEAGLDRSRHKTTFEEYSAIDAAKKVLELHGVHLSFDAIESYDKAVRKDPDRNSLTKFFPTEYN
jgi:hypothetical protein